MHGHSIATTSAQGLDRGLEYNGLRTPCALALGDTADEANGEWDTNNLCESVCVCHVHVACSVHVCNGVGLEDGGQTSNKRMLGSINISACTCWHTKKCYHQHTPNMHVAKAITNPPSTALAAISSCAL